MYNIRLRLLNSFQARYLVHYIHTNMIPMSASTHSMLDLNRIMSSLSKAGQVDEARNVFDKILHKDEFSWNIMIAAYANSGRLTEARELFNKTEYKSAVTWNLLISGYSHNGRENEAIELFGQMQAGGENPTEHTLCSLLRVCSNFALFPGGQQIHTHALKTSLDSSLFVVVGLVDMYAKCKCVWEAEYLFVTTPVKKNHVLWTAMLTGYSQNNDELKAIKCFRDMRAQGVECNQFAFPGILTACGAVSLYRVGLQVHGCIAKSGFGTNIFVESAVIDMYAKCGDLTSARKMLQGMEVPEVISWNSMIVGCVEVGFEEEALSLFREMHANNMTIDDFTYPSILKSLASLMDSNNGKCVHSLIIKTGFQAYRTIDNTLIDMYAKQGNLHFASKVFNEVPHKDVISWTSMITGHTHNDSYEGALRLFCDMRRKEVLPDQFIMANILSVCAELAVLEFGRQVHANSAKLCPKSSLSIDNSLITMYAKCGCLEDANKVFNSMRAQDVVSWTALIVGFAQNGKGKDSLLLYEKMITSGVKPDSVTFIGLLFACSHAGLVENGRRYFDSMVTVYGIKPGAQHYACMIDLLGRSGKFTEVKELLNQMAVEPDATLWKALLGACRVHGNLELAEKAANQLFHLEPTNAMPYVMLSNIYSTFCRWEDVARVRKMMKLNGINKEAGCSWIEVNGKVHKFLSEDRSHPRTVDIYSKVDNIMVLIKRAGYVPDMKFALHDTDKEGKESSLAYHSEKLAVAFALLEVPEGVHVRIFKNVRVCGDCHMAMKFVSEVYQRRISLRDSNYFHHFHKGNCSCGDYW